MLHSTLSFCLLGSRNSQSFAHQHRLDKVVIRSLRNLFPLLLHGSIKLVRASNGLLISCFNREIRLTEMCWHFKEPRSPVFALHTIISTVSSVQKRNTVPSFASHESPGIKKMHTLTILNKASNKWAMFDAIGIFIPRFETHLRKKRVPKFLNKNLKKKAGLGSNFPLISWMDGWVGGTVV